MFASPYRRVFLAALMLLSGCATAPRFEPLPEYAQRFEPPPRAVPTEGAIFASDTNVYLYEDDRARRIGDILTIHLRESTAAKKDANTEVKKDNSNNIANPTLFGSGVEFNAPGVVPLASNKGNNLAFDIGSNHDFKGEAQADQSNSLTGDITAVVVGKQPNGNLIVRGEKFVTLNQGDERIAIQGEVRPADIAPDNSVDSQRVANAQIVYDGKGAVADANVLGWVSRFFISALMPF